MKKLAILMCGLCLLSSVSYAAAVDNAKAVNEDNKAVESTVPANEGIKRERPSKEEMIKLRKAREAAFEQKLGLTEAQKTEARELRLKAHQQMKPIMEQLMAKKQEAEMVKRSRLATWAQEEKLAVLDKEIQDLEKQAGVIRKKNMKEFESILTRDQKKILKQMKKEGRQRFEQRKKECAEKKCIQPVSE